MNDNWANIRQKRGYHWYRFEFEVTIGIFNYFSRGKMENCWINREILFPFLASNHAHRVQEGFNRIFSRFYAFFDPLLRVPSTAPLFFMDTRI